MKTSKVSDIAGSNKVCHLIEEVVETNEEFKRRYADKDCEKLGLPSTFPYSVETLSYHLTPVLSLFDGNVQGKTILNLGCGCKNSFDAPFAEWTNARTWEPWLSRALTYLGARAIGVDIGDLEGEDFEHYSLNLLEDNSLSFLPDNSVDLAFARLLFCSPRLCQELFGKTFSDDGEREEHAQEKLMAILLPQLDRIVKPEGYFIYTSGKQEAK